MYKNLKKQVDLFKKEKKMKQSDLARLLDTTDKTISKKINVIGEFNANEQIKIYKFIKGLGFDGSIDELFDYTCDREKIISISENDNYLSIWLKEQMKAHNITNSKLADDLYVSVDTICNWRNGKVKTIKDKRVLINLAKYFDVSPLDLLNYSNEGFEGFVDEEYYDYKIAINNMVDDIYRVLMSRTYLLGIDKKYFNFSDDVINEIKNNIKRQVITFFEEDLIHDYCISSSNITEKERDELMRTYEVSDIYSKNIIKEVEYEEREIKEIDNILSKHLNRKPTIEEMEVINGKEFIHRQALIDRGSAISIDDVVPNRKGEKKNGKK